MRYDAIVEGGIAVSPGGLYRSDIGILDGKIAAVADSLSACPADRHIDASGCYVLPGFIDAHNHPVYEDSFEGISGQLALGGVTTFIPFMPLVPEWGVDADAREPVLDFISEGEHDSYLDFNCHGIIQTDTRVAKVIPALAGLGIRSAKFFTCFSGRGMMVDDLSLCEGLAAVAAAGCIAMVHAENESIVTYLERRLKQAGRVRPEDYPPSRPAIAEAEAAFRVLSIAETTRCPTYLVHLSAQESLDVVRWFRRRNRATVFAETCTHYLVFTEDELTKQGARVKIAPPLRSQSDVDAFWHAVGDGTIDVVSSDGSGRTLKSKQSSDIFTVPSGMPGAQSLVQLAYWHGVSTGRITVQRLVWVLSEQPARIFGLYPQKGSLSVGADADIVVYDPARAGSLKHEDLFGRSDYSPYEGSSGLGVPRLTMQRGAIVLEDGKLQVNKGHGSFIPALAQDMSLRAQFPVPSRRMPNSPDQQS